MHILTILGTARHGRQSEHVARYMHGLLEEKEGVTASIAFPEEYIESRTISSDEKTEKTSSWRELVHQADKFLIVTPEYNHGYPGDLKILLDMAYTEYQGKVVALCGVSSGGFGGVRALENIKPVLSALHLSVVPQHTYVSNVSSVFAEDGTLKDGSYQEKFDTLITRLIDF